MNAQIGAAVVIVVGLAVCALAVPGGSTSRLIRNRWVRRAFFGRTGSWNPRIERFAQIFSTGFLIFWGVSAIAIGFAHL